MKPVSPTMVELLKRCLTASALFLGLAAHADVVVPVGATVNASASTVDFGCTDLIVGGSFNLGTGSLVNVRDVLVQPGGSVSASTGSITLARRWSNSGSFSAGTGNVTFADNPGCASASAIDGNTTFYNLALTSSIGRTITLASGTTQTVLARLTVTGTAAMPIQLVSGGTSLAFINLTGPGQTISNVGVTNVTASGQWLAMGQINRNPTGLAQNWFGDGPVVPTLSGAALLLLTLFIAFFAFFSGARSRRIHRGRGSL